MPLGNWSPHKRAARQLAGPQARRAAIAIRSRPPGGVYESSGPQHSETAKKIRCAQGGAETRAVR
eukprot:9115556-Pyramimonas_sp.AAC.1